MKRIEGEQIPVNAIPGEIGNFSVTNCHLSPHVVVASFSDDVIVHVSRGKTRTAIRWDVMGDRERVVIDAAGNFIYLIGGVTADFLPARILDRVHPANQPVCVCEFCDQGERP